MNITEKLNKQLLEFPISGLLETKDGGRVLPICSYRSDALFETFVKLKNEGPSRRIEFQAKITCDFHDKLLIPVLTAEEVKALEDYSNDIPETLGNAIFVKFENLKSTFTKTNKAWAIEVKAPAINEWRAKIGLRNQEAPRLTFAEKTPEQPLDSYIRKAKDEARTIKKINMLSPHVFNMKTLMAATEKKWREVAQHIMNMGVVPCLKIVEDWCENAELKKLYNLHQSRLEQDFILSPTSLVPQELFGSLCEEEVLALLQKIPTKLLNADHLHEAVKLRFYGVARMLGMECITPYQRTCSLASEDAELYDMLISSFQKEQGYLADRQKRKSIVPDPTSIIAHMSNEEQAYELICKYSVDDLNETDYECAKNRQWGKITSYLYLQEVVENNELVAGNRVVSRHIIITPSRIDIIDEDFPPLVSPHKQHPLSHSLENAPNYSAAVLSNSFINEAPLQPEKQPIPMRELSRSAPKISFMNRFASRETKAKDV